MPHKILIVDDDKVNIALVKFALAEQRYQVFVAYDGEQGMEMVRKESPDLIILDVMMPNMNGYEFMGQLKAMQGFETTPTLMLTANETMQDLFRLEGVRGYFVKPVILPRLIEKIRACLGPNPLFEVSPED